jgi:mono/diheme cytochrome c family protein
MTSAVPGWERGQLRSAVGSRINVGKLYGPPTVAAAVMALAVGWSTVADAMLVAIILAAGLEAFLAICLGCHVFSPLMRLGVIPDAVCADCANIWTRAGIGRVPPAHR